MTRALLNVCFAAVFVAGSAHAVEDFPLGDVFRPLLADPAEPRSFLSLLRMDTPTDTLTLGSVGFGTNFGLRRWPGERAGEGWQVGFFGAVFSQFNLSASADDLVNSDFVVGVPLSYKRSALAARLRLWHQSSHLGDELILSGAAPPRLDLAIEAVDGLLAFEPDHWRFYGGGYYLLRRQPRDLKRSGLHAGIEYVGRAAVFAGGRLVGGVDVKWFDQNNWGAGVSGKIGLQFGRPAPERRGLTVLLETYDGFSPFGQFFSSRASYFGGSVQFDF